MIFSQFFVLTINPVFASMIDAPRRVLPAGWQLPRTMVAAGKSFLSPTKKDISPKKNTPQKRKARRGRRRTDDDDNDDDDDDDDESEEMHSALEDDDDGDDDDRVDEDDDVDDKVRRTPRRASTTPKKKAKGTPNEENLSAQRPRKSPRTRATAK